MGNGVTINWKGEEIILCSDGTLWIPSFKAWVISDVHFGKITHFRKNGISLPARAKENNRERIVRGIEYWKPEKVIFTGDLFHSTANSEMAIVQEIIREFTSISFVLTEGNHDRYTQRAFEKIGIQVVANYDLGPLRFEHEKSDFSGSISGHLHPVVELAGKGRQKLRLKAFIVHPDYIILPAFGHFTGGHPYELSQNEKAYLLGEGQGFTHPGNSIN